MTDDKYTILVTDAYESRWDKWLWGRWFWKVTGGTYDYGVARTKESAKRKAEKVVRKDKARGPKPEVSEETYTIWSSSDFF